MSIVATPIDPRYHTPLALQQARVLAQQFGDRPHDWLGYVYTCIHRAAAKFEPARGFQFSTYACSKIRGGATREYHKRRGSRMITEGGKVRWCQAVHPKLELRDRPARTGPSFEDLEGLRFALRQLDDRSSFVIRMRLDGYTLKEVTRIMGLTKPLTLERVRQIELEAIARMRGILAGRPRAAAGWAYVGKADRLRNR